MSSDKTDLEAQTSHIDLGVGSEDQGNLGDIKISLPVVENMVRMVVLEVEGVVDVIGSGSSAISGIFASKGENRSGVKVVEDESGAYSIEVRVSLVFGVELANIAYTIQQKVIEKIAKMTSKPVTKVDVFIDRVEKEAAEAPAEKKSKAKAKPAPKKQEPKEEAPVEAEKTE